MTIAFIVMLYYVYNLQSKFGLTFSNLYDKKVGFSNPASHCFIVSIKVFGMLI